MSRADSKLDNPAHPGLFIKGAIIGRSRQEVGDPPRERITYRILTENTVANVSRFGEHDYASVGEKVDWPVSARSFINRFGMPQVTFTYRDGNGIGKDF